MDNNVQHNNGKKLSPNSHNSARMKDKSSKISSEKVLSAAKLKPLDAHTLENAQRRVWNELSHSIDQINKSKTMPEADLKQNKLKPSFWSKYNKFIAFGSVAMLSIMSTGGTTVYLSWKNDKDQKVAENNKKVEEKALDLQSLAAARLTELTGLTVDEYKKVENANKANSDTQTTLETNQQNKPGTGAAAASSKTYTDAQKVATNEEIKEIAQKLANKETKVYYTKAEMTSADSTNSGFGIFYGYMGGQGQQHPKVDPSKPLIVETWTSTSYSKNLLTQNGNIINLNIYTPEFSIDYRGGSYAIKTIYEGEQNYFGGIEGEEQNPDIQFLKYIIDENPNIKKVGTKEIDGKLLTIFEENYNNDAASTMSINPEFKSFIMSQKYYVDLEGFKLVLVETYNDGKLSFSIKNISSESSTDNSKVKDYSELGNTQIKEIKQDFSKNGQNPKLTEFIKKFDLLYLESLNSNIQYAYDYESQDEYTKLIMNSDFDPMYAANVVGMNGYVAPKAGYQQGNNLSVNISDTDPRAQYTTNVEGRTITQEETTVKLNGSSKKAYTFTETYNNNVTDPSTSFERPADLTLPQYASYILIFESDNGYWYTFNEYSTDTTKSAIKNSPLNFVSLNQTKAAEMDRENEERQKAYPELNYSTKLDEISESIRLLPGDLSVAYGLTAMNAVKSNKSGKDSTCDKYYLKGDQSYAALDCLVEKYDGFKITFNDSSNQVQPLEGTAPSEIKLASFKYLDFVVLNVKSTQIDDTLDSIKALQASYNGPDINPNRFIVKDISGKTVILTTSLEEKDANLILNGVSLNNGYDVLKQQIDSAVATQPIMYKEQSSSSQE